MPMWLRGGEQKLNFSSVWKVPRTEEPGGTASQGQGRLLQHTLKPAWGFPREQSWISAPTTGKASEPTRPNLSGIRQEELTRAHPCPSPEELVILRGKLCDCPPLPLRRQNSLLGRESVQRPVFWSPAFSPVDDTSYRMCTML